MEMGISDNKYEMSTSYWGVLAQQSTAPWTVSPSHRTGDREMGPAGELRAITEEKCNFFPWSSSSVLAHLTSGPDYLGSGGFLGAVGCLAASWPLLDSVSVGPSPAVTIKNVPKHCQMPLAGRLVKISPESNHCPGVM